VRCSNSASVDADASLPSLRYTNSALVDADASLLSLRKRRNAPLSTAASQLILRGGTLSSMLRQKSYCSLGKLNPPATSSYLLLSRSVMSVVAYTEFTNSSIVVVRNSSSPRHCQNVHYRHRDARYYVLYMPDALNIG